MNSKRPQHKVLQIQLLALGRHQNVAIETSNDRISNDNTYINKYRIQYFWNKWRGPYWI